MRSREHLEEGIELIILVNSESVIVEDIERSITEFIKIGKIALSFLEEKNC